MAFAQWFGSVAIRLQVTWVTFHFKGIYNLKLNVYSFCESKVLVQI